MALNLPQNITIMFYEVLLFAIGRQGWPNRINEDKYAPPILYKLLPVKPIVGYLNQMWPLKGHIVTHLPVMCL